MDCTRSNLRSQEAACAYAERSRGALEGLTQLLGCGLARPSTSGGFLRARTSQRAVGGVPSANPSRSVLISPRLKPRSRAA